MVTYHLTVLLILYLKLIQASNLQNLHFSTVTCKSHNNDIIKAFSCFINETNPEALTVHITVKEDLYPKAAATLNMLESNGRKRKLYTVDIDLCNLVTNTRRNLLKFFTEGIRRTAINLPKECPFRKDTLYGLHEFRISRSILLTFYKKMDFQMVIPLMDPKKGKFATLEVTGSMCTLNNCS